MDEVYVNFRTFGFRFIILDKMFPDFIMEHLVKERIFRLKTNTRFDDTRPVARSVKDAIIGSRIGI